MNQSAEVGEFHQYLFWSQNTEEEPEEQGSSAKVFRFKYYDYIFLQNNSAKET